MLVGTALGTIAGGAGSDLLIFNNSANAAANSTVANSTISQFSVNAVIAGGSGDTVRIANLSNGGVAAATGLTAKLEYNYFSCKHLGCFNPHALSQSMSIAGQATATGAAAVWSDGTDSIIMINGGAGAAAGLISNFSFRIDNVDLVTTTAGAVGVSASNFAFTIANGQAGADYNLNITLSWA